MGNIGCFLGQYRVWCLLSTFTHPRVEFSEFGLSCVQDWTMTSPDVLLYGSIRETGNEQERIDH